MHARRMFVDGVAGVIGGTNGQEPREAFQMLVEGLHREKLTAVLALEPGLLQGGPQIAPPEESIADTVIRLPLEDNARSTTRSIEIVKSRGHGFQMGRHSFEIRDEHGIVEQGRRRDVRLFCR